MQAVAVALIGPARNGFLAHGDNLPAFRVSQGAEFGDLAGGFLFGGGDANEDGDWDGSSGGLHVFHGAKCIQIIK
jgi:hypothetical protein